MIKVRLGTYVAAWILTLIVLVLFNYFVLGFVGNVVLRLVLAFVTNLPIWAVFYHKVKVA